MLPVLSKHKLITAALLATLALSACGKKKDVLSAPPQQPTKTSDSESPAPIDETETGDTNGRIGGGLPGGQQEEQVEGAIDYAPPSESEPTPIYPEQPPTSDRGSGKTTEPRRPVTPPVVDNRPAPNPGTNDVPSNYIPSDASNVTREGLNKRFTGGVTPEGLLYTSSSTDELLDYLRARNQRVNEESRRLNRNAAASVVFAKISTSSVTGDAVLTLKVQEGADVNAYNLLGSAAAGPANSLTAVRSGNGEVTTGRRAVSGTLKCLDFDGKCENLFARLVIGTSPSSAIVNVVFRRSEADIFYSLPGQRSGSPEYEAIRSMWLNTTKNIRSENRVTSVRMNSWEVVNGRSGVTLTVRTAGNELLGFAGPLLAPEAGTGVNVRMSRLAKDQEDSLDLINTKATKLNYANWIADARMIANNGLGQVRLNLKMRKVGNYSQDQFAVTFMRRIKPIVELNDAELR